MSAAESGARRGIFLCVAIVFFGFVILGGMYLAPHAQSPKAPASAVPLPPAQRLKFVSLDVQRRHPAAALFAGALKQLDPDFVCLQDVASEDVVPLAEALGMTRSFHMELFASAQNLDGSHATYGNCVLAKGEVDAGAPIVGPRGNLGAWCVAVVGGNKFRVASVHLSGVAARDGELRALVDAWEKTGRMPIVIAGLFGPAPGKSDLVGPETGWFDGLSPFTQVGGSEDCRIVFSPGWACVAGGPKPADSGAPVWVVATSVHAAMPATTRAVVPAGEEP